MGMAKTAAKSTSKKKAASKKTASKAKTPPRATRGGSKDVPQIKIKKVIDNTAKDVEILLELQNGVSPDLTFMQCSLHLVSSVTR